MGGITMEPGFLPYEQDAWRIATVAARDLVQGDVVILHASEIDAIDLSAAAADQFLGVVGQEYGGSASSTTTQPAGVDARPYVHLWGRNINTRIEASVSVAYLADLMISGTTAGALVTADGSGPVVGRCKKAIASGADPQFTLCDINPRAGAGAGAGDVYTIQGTIADVSTASSAWSASAPYAGNIISIRSTLQAAITVADAALSFELGGTAITGGGITIATAGSAPGDVDLATPTALNAIAAGGVIEMITDGGSTTTAAAELIFTILRT